MTEDANVESKTWALPKKDRTSYMLGAVVSAFLALAAIGGAFLLPAQAGNVLGGGLIFLGWAVLAVGMLIAAAALAMAATWRIVLHDGRLETKGLFNNRTLDYSDVVAAAPDWLGLRLANGRGENARILLLSYNVPLHFAGLLTELAGRCPAVAQVLTPDPPWESPPGRNLLYPLGLLAVTTDVFLILFLAGLIGFAEGVSMDQLIVVLGIGAILLSGAVFLLLYSKTHLSAKTDELRISGFLKSATHTLNDVASIAIEKSKDQINVVLTASGGERTVIPVGAAGAGLPTDYLVAVLAHLYLGKSIADVEVK